MAALTEDSLNKLDKTRLRGTSCKFAKQNGLSKQ